MRRSSPPRSAKRLELQAYPLASASLQPRGAPIAAPETFPLIGRASTGAKLTVLSTQGVAHV